MLKSWTMPVAQALQRHTGSWKAPMERPNDPAGFPEPALVPAGCGEEPVSGGPETPPLAPANRTFEELAPPSLRCVWGEGEHRCADPTQPTAAA